MYKDVLGLVQQSTLAMNTPQKLDNIVRSTGPKPLLRVQIVDSILIVSDSNYLFVDYMVR